jgi:hypothetical protein
MEDIHIKIQKDLSLSKDDIDNIVAGALEGGITYWCTKAKVVNKEYKDGEFTNSVVSRGGSIELYEDDGSFKVLDLEKLKKGIKTYYETNKRPFDIDDMDADDYDVIIQLAVFDEVVYG